MANVHDEQRSDSNGPDAADRSAHSSRSESSYSGGGLFEIRVKGHLNSQWSEWLEGLAMTLCDNGEMILTGNIVDQAALLGILNKLNRLNLALLAVSKVHQPDQH